MKKLDWETIKTLYIQGEQTAEGLIYPTFEKLADRSNRNACAIRRIAGKDNWTEQRKLFTAKTETLRTEKKSEVMASESVQFDSDCLKLARAGLSMVAQAMKEKEPVEKISKALKDYQSVGKLAFGESVETTGQTVINNNIQVVSENAKKLTSDIISGKNTE